MAALGLRLHEAVGVPIFQAYRAMFFRVGRDRAHEVRHAFHTIVERLLALALGGEDALALPAEVSSEGGSPTKNVRGHEDNVEGLDDAHQRATARAA